MSGIDSVVVENKYRQLKFVEVFNDRFNYSRSTHALETRAFWKVAQMFGDDSDCSPTYNADEKGDVPARAKARAAIADM